MVTFDGRGNGRSDRPHHEGAYLPEEIVGDMVAILAEVGAEKAVVVAHCHAVDWSFELAAQHPELVSGLVAIAPGIPGLGDPNPNWVEVNKHWEEDPANPEGWRDVQSGVLATRRLRELDPVSGSETLAVEPYSSKRVEDMVEWALEADVEAMIQADEEEAPGASTEASEALCRSIRCPVLVLHGSEDRCQMPTRGERVAELTGGRFVLMEGVGHLAPGREPVVVNRHITEFVDSIARNPHDIVSTWTRGRDRRPKALYVSSPIGLGHAQRDLAIATELKALVPDLEVEWLAQSPVTSVLEAAGETIHPASKWLASESDHWASEATGHELNAFQALRRMDEILVANFMVFQEVVEEGSFDLVLADEAWDIDHFWHENPELKRGITCVDDRLRRVPPDGRGRRAGSVSHCRLQRRDDRAHRSLSPHSRPLDLRRQSRRRDSRLLRPRPR